MLNFRPHHFLCALNFKGKGYSPSFVDNFKQIMQTLNAPDGDNAKIKVIDHLDAICEPCPHNRGNTCAKQTKIESLDNRHAKALDIQAGDVLSWGEAKQRIKSKINVAVFHQICKGCSWKSLGVCEKGLRSFLKS